MTSGLPNDHSHAFKHLEAFYGSTVAFIAVLCTLRVPYLYSSKYIGISIRVISFEKFNCIGISFMDCEPTS